MKVLFASAECVPFFKIGGLGDVAEALPKEINKNPEIDMRVILPYYNQMPEKFKCLCEDVLYFYVDIGWRHQYVGVKKLTYDTMDYYFIDNEFYFGRDNVYGYGDDGERFGFFQIAIIEMMKRINFVADIVHVNDYHTAMIPFLLKEKYSDVDEFESIQTVLTIHNIEFQGCFSSQILPDLFSLSEDYYYNGSVRYGDAVNFLKTGIVYSGQVVTVSPSYAREIQTPEFGFGLDGILRMESGKVSGILNGINYEINNPETDKVIPATFSINDLSVKQVNKESLQRKMGLPIKNVPLLAIVSRLTHQKGCQLILDELENILQYDIQIVVLGTGEYGFEQGFQDFARWFPTKCSVSISFNSELAQLFYAGADIFIMPSSFEPCGLSQMVAMRYGTLPVVHEIGGLKDTVTPYNPITKSGTGFGFVNYVSYYFMNAVKQALNLYENDKDTWEDLKKNAMKQNFDWEVSSQKYINLYQSLLDRR